MRIERMPRVHVDLDLPEEDRWSKLISSRKTSSRRLLDEALGDLFLPTMALRAPGAALWATYKSLGGRYCAEMESIGRILNIPKPLVLLANCSYEIHQAGGRIWDEVEKRMVVHACTAGVRDSPVGPIHVRAMDWGLAGIGRSSFIAEFQSGGRKFFGVTTPGYVGLLSGMVPGGYSVTMNLAPPSEVPVPWAWGPGFLIREVLETADTFADAVQILRDAPLSCPVLFMVCGTKPGQAVVIERRRGSSAVRKMKDGVLAVANHHLAARMTRYNECFLREDSEGASVMVDTGERYEAMFNSLTGLSSGADLDDAAAVLDEEPILNEGTTQQMAFCPATGEIEAWRVKQ